MTRREFTSLLGSASLAAAAQTRPVVCVFSKHMAQFGYDELGKRAKDIGFQGIDLTVRPKGHVLPERAAQDLPKAVEAIRAHGLSVPMITTDIKSAADPNARAILSAAGKLKIPYWKVGYHTYTRDDVEAEIAKTREAVSGIVALSKEYGVTAGWHNHSGNYFGSAVWDIRAVIHDYDPKWIGYYFDPGHATIEGGLAGWKIAQNMVIPRVKMVAIKDFFWEKAADGKWKNRWCPMGEGMVDWERVFAGFAAAKFPGPYSLHLEYQASDELAAMARDLKYVQKRLKAAYGE
jgi:L-ribulose-5-phosphate 3-epimerase